MLPEVSGQTPLPAHVMLPTPSQAGFPDFKYFLFAKNTKMTFFPSVKARVQEVQLQPRAWLGQSHVPAGQLSQRRCHICALHK